MLFRRAALALVAGAMAISGPVVAMPASAQAAAPTKLVVGITQDVDSLNPFLSYTAFGTQLGRLMYEFLTTYKPTDESTDPALATSWTTSADRLTWTYTIRSGVKWSDGQPVTAKDIAFTYNLMMTNQIAATANGNFVSNFGSVTAPSDTTLVITLKQPQATMLALDIPIVPQHVWAGVTNDIKNYANTPTGGQPVVGDGPFLLSDFRQGQYVKLVANPTYWRGKPKVDEIDFVHFDNTDAAVQALRKGDVDLVSGLSPAQYNALQGASGITTNKGAQGRIVELNMNPGAATNTGQPIGDGNPVLKDVAFRRAIAQAIDTNTLVEKVYGGYAQAATGDIPSKFSIWHWDPSPSQARKFDLTAAGNALTAAGYPLVNGQRMDKTGKPITLRLYGETDRTQDAQEIQYIAGWLKDLGITVDPQMVSGDKMNALGTAATYDLTISSWGGDPDPDSLLTLQTCSQRPNANSETGNTDNFFCDPAYDSLYNQSVAAPTQAQRVSIVRQLQQEFYSQVPSMTMVYPDLLEAYRSDKFAPFQVQPEPGGVITNQNGYWGYYSATPLAAASGGSATTTIVIVVVVVVIVLIGVVFWLVSRRRKAATADDRE